MTGLDAVILTTVTENHVDMLLSDGPNVTRAGLAHHFDPKTSCVRGENGIAIHVDVYWGRYRYQAMFDTGMTGSVLVHNAQALAVRLDELDHVVLSHGHPDHYGGLLGLLDEREAAIPISTHPDAFLPRYVRLASGQVAPFYNSDLTRESIARRCGRLVEHRSVLEVGPGLIATGAIPRDVDFEAPPTDMSAPNALIHLHDCEVGPDIVPDDQALVILIGEDGIVILAGCAHAGIINTVRYAQQITGRKRVVGVFGGFHLGFPGTPHEKTEKTIEALRELEVEFLCPMHCTGMEAMMEIARAFPERFLLNCTGTQVRLEGSRSR